MQSIWNRTSKKYVTEYLDSVGAIPTREQALDGMYMMLEPEYSGGPSEGAIEELETQIKILRGVLGTLLYSLLDSGVVDREALQKILECD